MCHLLRFARVLKAAGSSLWSWLSDRLRTCNYVWRFSKVSWVLWVSWVFLGLMGFPRFSEVFISCFIVHWAIMSPCVKNIYFDPTALTSIRSMLAKVSCPIFLMSEDDRSRLLRCFMAGKEKSCRVLEWGKTISHVDQIVLTLSFFLQD